MKNRGTRASNIGTTAGGGQTENVCPYCAAVGRTASNKNNYCYFDPKNMTGRRKWDQKLMDEKGVAYNDDELRRGTAQAVIHRHYIKENLFYEASLSCSPTLSYIHTPYAQRILPQKNTGVVDSGATHLYVAPSALHGPPTTSASQISVGTVNGQI